MKLKQLDIKNFKGIESATIENLEEVNIFVGKNNVGKSSIFDSITILKKFPIYPEIIYDELPVHLFTGENYRDNVLEITLTYELHDDERSKLWEEYSRNSLSPDRIQGLINSGFTKNIQYVFRSFRKSLRFGLYEIRFMSEDNEFCTILLREKQNHFAFNDFQNIITKRDMVSNVLRNQKISGDYQDVKKKLENVLILFKQKMEKTFVFSASRDSQRELPAEETLALDAQGSNLVQRIYSIKQNEDETWDKLRDFVNSSLPNIGSLQSRTKTKLTRTVFSNSKWKIDIDIHEMGSGIQQLLMMACVLISRDKGYLFLIETPEHHLHPGAQRILLNFIGENIKDNQVTITSHSPVFLNQTQFPIYSVSQRKEGTKINKVTNLEELSQALKELGSRNSDVLMADFVFFIEGTTDEKIFRVWAKTLGIDFDSKNIFCIQMKSCRNYQYYVNSDVLNKISRNSRTPRMFVIDRDEKPEEAINKIKEQTQNAHVLEKREIENYLLHSEIILDVMKKKAQSNVEAQQKLENITHQNIEDLMLLKADDLKQVVMFKRIREIIGGGPYLPYDEIKQLLEKSTSVSLSSLTYDISKLVQRHMEEKCDKRKIEKIISEQFKIVEGLWNKGNKEKLSLAPGEEILSGIFKEFNLNYNKDKDGLKIAEQMKQSDFPDEIRSIIKKIDELSKVDE